MRILFLFLFSACYLEAMLLENEVKEDLALAGIPAMIEPVASEILDVAIIGGGHSGMGLSFALRKRKIFNVAIFDKAPRGLEGPWLKTARMPVLRSKKTGLAAPALGIPRLSFQAYYQQKFGDWEQLGAVSTTLWAEYLHWYRDVLNMPIHNEWHLLSIVPEERSFKLLFEGGKEVRARKVVLATGRDGFGGFQFPEYSRFLPKDLYFHTGELIDPKIFRDRKVCVIGSGSSAFDAAGCALESGAESVVMLFRKKEIPTVNHLVLFDKWKDYYSMSDEEKICLFQLAYDQGPPPPVESIARVMKWKNFHLHPQTQVEGFDQRDRILVKTDNGSFDADLIVFATGYAAKPSAVPEISLFASEILLWSDRHQGLYPKFAQFPYLGKHFEFLEKFPGQATYLKDIHCFNYGAFLSHGRIAGDIDQLAIGLERLADGIAIDLCDSN